MGRLKRASISWLFIVVALAAFATVPSMLWSSSAGAADQKGQWEVFTPKNSTLPDSSINALAFGADGALWIGTENGLAQLHQGKWQVFTTENSGLSDDFVATLTIAADDSVWTGSGIDMSRPECGGGLSRFHQGKWQVYAPGNSDLPSPVIAGLASAPDGAVWIGDGFGSLALFDQGTGRSTPRPTATGPAASMTWPSPATAPSGSGPIKAWPGCTATSGRCSRPRTAACPPMRCVPSPSHPTARFGSAPKKMTVTMPAMPLPGSIHSDP